MDQTSSYAWHPSGSTSTFSEVLSVPAPWKQNPECHSRSSTQAGRCAARCCSSQHISLTLMTRQEPQQNNRCRPGLAPAPGRCAKGGTRQNWSPNQKGHCVAVWKKECQKDTVWKKRNMCLRLHTALILHLVFCTRQSCHRADSTSMDRVCKTGAGSGELTAANFRWMWFWTQWMKWVCKSGTV